MTLVSAIMPTRGRQPWAHQALECFLSQTYPSKELVIVDDDDDPSFPSGILAPGVVHWFNASRHTIPIKRNMACKVALGDIVAHWDSDDWSAPERMADQVERLEEYQKAMTGYHSMLFVEEDTERAFRYHGLPNYAIGTSLMYRRAWWGAHPFDESKPLGEDNTAVKIAADAGQLVAVDANGLMVARIHSGNSWPKNLGGREFRPVPYDEVPAAFWGER